MRQGWQEFVHQSLKGAADDPHVRLLRERLRSGSSVVRVHLDESGRQPQYLILLSEHRQLSEMRVPHSESFTRWSLEAGTRLATPEEEARRFALVLRERFMPLEEKLGREYLDGILIEQLSALGPPRVQGWLAGRSLPHSAAVFGDGSIRRNAQERIEGVLAALARDLGTSLKYSEQEAAGLLDAALEHYFSERYGSGTQSTHSSR